MLRTEFVLMFDYLSTKLQSCLQSLRGQSKISEKNIKDVLQAIQNELLEADVSLKSVKKFIERVEEKSIGTKVLSGIKPEEQFTKIIYDSLVETLGGKSEESSQSFSQALNLSNNDSAILLLGLQGAGKTTTAAKIAFQLKKSGKNPLLIGCDFRRAAAIEQLEILAKKANVDFCKSDNLETLCEVAFKQAKLQANDVLIFDTAGRLSIDEELMKELVSLEKNISSKINCKKLLVVDSLIGQEAANIAESFNTQIGIDGVILTKLDSDSRGGAALSIVEAISKPIKLASIGEKLEDIEIFYPERIASRILGMGDIISLVEKAQEKIEEEESKKLEAELLKGNFNYQTFLTAQNMFNKLGDFAQIFKMMGMGGMLSQMGLGSNGQEALMEQGKERMKKFQIAINSMSKEEKLKPELLSNHHSAKSRRERIAKGSGLKSTDIDKLTAEFNKMAKLFKSIGPMLGMKESKTNPMDLLTANLPKKQKQVLASRGFASKPKPQKQNSGPNIKGFRD